MVTGLGSCEDTDIVIPSTYKSKNVVGINGYAFEHCTGLTELPIPASLKKLGRNAFYDCKNLTSITVDEDNPVFDSRNNCNAIIETESDKLLFGCKETVIPDSVSSIGAEAFGGCTSLESVVIPDSVTWIGNDIFVDCRKLTSIYVSKNSYAEKQLKKQGYEKLLKYDYSEEAAPEI